MARRSLSRCTRTKHHTSDLAINRTGIRSGVMRAARTSTSASRKVNIYAHHSRSKILGWKATAHKHNARCLVKMEDGISCGKELTYNGSSVTPLVNGHFAREHPGLTKKVKESSDAGAIHNHFGNMSHVSANGMTKLLFKQQVFFVLWIAVALCAPPFGHTLFPFFTMAICPSFVMPSRAKLNHILVCVVAPYDTLNARLTSSSLPTNAIMKSSLLRPHYNVAGVEHHHPSPLPRFRTLPEPCRASFEF